MYAINGNDIEVTRGDTLVLEIVFTGRAISPASQVIFTLKKRVKDETALVEKVCTVTDNRTTVELAPEDTDQKPGTYWWDVRVKTAVANGTDVRTPMENGAFQILEAVGNG